MYDFSSKNMKAFMLIFQKRYVFNRGRALTFGMVYAVALI